MHDVFYYGHCLLSCPPKSDDMGYRGEAARWKIAEYFAETLIEHARESKLGIDKTVKGK